MRGLTAGCVSVQHLSLTFEAQLPLGCSDFSARFCDRVTFLKISKLDTFRYGVPPCSGEPEHARVLRGVCGERLGPMYLRSGYDRAGLRRSQEARPFHVKHQKLGRKAAYQKPSTPLKPLHESIDQEKLAKTNELPVTEFYSCPSLLMACVLTRAAGDLHRAVGLFSEPYLVRVPDKLRGPESIVGFLTGLRT